MRKLLVTGATGFLGSHVARVAAKRGFEVIACARAGSDKWRLKDLASDITWLELDLINDSSIEAALGKTRPDIIIHCAAYGVDYRQQDSRLAVQTNIVGTHYLLETAAKYAVNRFVHIGSCFEYGDKSEPIKESESLNPTGIYGSTKAAASILALERARSLGLPLVIVRPFGMYGPLEGSHRLVPQVLNACRQRVPLKLTGGAQVRDYTFVIDAAEAIVYLAVSDNFPAGEVFNLASGVPVVLKDFVLECARQFDGEELMLFGELPYRPGEMWYLVGDVEKWLAYFRFPVAKTSLKEGIRIMIEWEYGQ